jgi:6-phosphofructokinase
MPNAFYAQSGGVTAVINASAAGVIETAREHRAKIRKVYAGRNGIIGALTEDLIDTGKETARAIAALKHTPGGAFGSCRYKLKSLEQSQAQYERLIEVFRAHDIRYFFYNGGNDSADTCLKVAQIADKLGYPLTAVHVPKTVDNDLAVTDNCPGFGSVAKYVATSMREAAFDVASMASTSTTPAGSRRPLVLPTTRRRRFRWCCCSPKCRSTRSVSARVSTRTCGGSAIAASAFQRA